MPKATSGEKKGKEERGGAVSFSTKITDISAMSDIVEQLASIGVTTSNAFLERGATPEGRAALSSETGIDQVILLQRLYLTDLERVSGIAWETANLLVHAGVSTVPDLAYRNPEDLHPHIKATNDTHKILKRAPTLAQVRGWVEHARELQTVIIFAGSETF